MKTILGLFCTVCSVSLQAFGSPLINIELGNNEALEAADAAGVEISANWTQVSGWPDFSNQALNYSDGTTSPATIDANFSGNLTTRIGVTSDVNTEMYNRGGGVNSGAGSDITVSGLPTAGNWADGYDVYVYFAPSSSDNSTRTLNLTLGGTTYYTELNTGSANYSGTFNPATSTNITACDSGKNVALFPNVTGNSFTFNAWSSYANSIALTGIQIVPLGSSTQPPSVGTGSPFPRNITYPRGIVPTVDSQTAMNTLIQQHWAQFISDYIVPYGTDKYWVNFNPSDETCSEAIGYSMLFCVMMENKTNDTQDMFDGLFRLYKSYLNNYGLMCWKINPDGTPAGTSSATDADEDVAMALLLADRQWGSSGSIDYLAEAQTVCSNLAFLIRDPAYFPPCDPGNAGDPNDIEWRKDKLYNPCYFSPAWYPEFYALTADSRWINTLFTSYEVVTGYLKQNGNGIMPDWCDPDGLTNTPIQQFVDVGYYIPGDTNSTYCDRNYVMDYDGYRIGWRLGLDYLWNGDTTAQSNCIALAQFMNTASTGNPIKIKAYLPDGTKVIGSPNMLSFVAPLTVAAMADSSGQAWLNTLYSNISTTNTYAYGKYFGDAQRLLAMLMVSGNFPNLCDLATPTNPPPANPELISNGGFITNATDWKLVSGPVHSAEHPDTDVGSIKMQGDGGYMYIGSSAKSVGKKS